MNTFELIRSLVYVNWWFIMILAQIAMINHFKIRSVLLKATRALESWTQLETTLKCRLVWCSLEAKARGRETREQCQPRPYEGKTIMDMQGHKNKKRAGEGQENRHIPHFSADFLVWCRPWDLDSIQGNEKELSWSLMKRKGFSWFFCFLVSGLGQANFAEAGDFIWKMGLSSQL